MSDVHVAQLRLVVTVENFEETLRFYRDALGMPEQLAVSSPQGRVAILDAGRATLEIADRPTAEFIDEVEVGRRVAGPLRVAFEVTDVSSATRRLEQAGATVLGEPRPTPFKSVNARLEAPAGLQLTLFERETKSPRPTVARIWRGRTTRERADEYEAYNYEVGIKPLMEKALGVQTLREDRDTETEFVTISYWESIEAMSRFTGADPTRVHHLDRDPEFLLELPERVEILKIRVSHGVTGGEGRAAGVTESS